MPRNPLIANTLYYHQLFEAWGRGIDLIIETCQHANLPEPEFFENTNGICVRIKAEIGTTEVTIHPIEKDLMPRQREILTVLQDEMTLSGIMELLEKPPVERTLQRDLTKLKELGFLEMFGFGRSARWRVVPSAKITQKDDKRRQKVQNYTENDTNESYFFRRC